MTPEKIRTLLDLITEAVSGEDANWQEKRLEIVQELKGDDKRNLAEFASWFERFSIWRP